jgi:hypothetical protein
LLVKKFYFEFDDSSLQIKFKLYVPCRVKKAFLTTCSKLKVSN